jgi:hypothetical protein
LTKFNFSRKTLMEHLSVAGSYETDYDNSYGIGVWIFSSVIIIFVVICECSCRKCCKCSRVSNNSVGEQHLLKQKPIKPLSLVSFFSFRFSPSQRDIRTIQFGYRHITTTTLSRLAKSFYLQNRSQCHSRGNPHASSTIQ